MSVTHQIVVFFDLSADGGDWFTLDSATKGKLDDATYVLAGNTATDITGTVSAFSINRGRARELDEIQAGICSFEVVNYDGEFVPEAFIPGGTYGSNTIPGKRIQILAAGIVIFDGVIQQWNLTYKADRSVSVSVVAEDSLAQLSRRRFNAWTTTGSQAPGARITAVLDRPEVVWPPNRAIDTGVSTLQSDNVSWGSNVLNYCQLVAASDLGRFFADRTGVLTFRDRHSLVNPTIKAAFTDDGTGIPFESAVLGYGSELLYSDVSVDREGGTAQTSTSTVARDLYGLRRLDVPGLLLDTDAQSAEMADFLLGIYSAPQPRVSALVLALDALTAAQQAQVAALDMADIVSLSWTPRGAPGGTLLDETGAALTDEAGLDLYVVGTSAPLTASYVVEGVGHDAAVADNHYVTLALSPLVGAEVFVLDDTSLGLLDSGVLAF